MKGKEENFHADRLWKTADRWFDRGLLLLLLLPVLAGVYLVYDSVYQRSNEVGNLDYFLFREDGMSEKLPDQAIGWLSLDQTEISFPVMQGSDNEEYLNKNPYGEFSLSGSIFLDFRNHPEWKDSYNLIYGHHMSGGRMFGALDSYLERKYFEEHRTGLLLSEAADYRLNLFAAAEVSAGNDLIFDCGDESHAEELKDWLASHADICRVPDGSKMIALSTCRDSGSTARLVVFATMHRIRQPGTLGSIKEGKSHVEKE